MSDRKLSETEQFILKEFYAGKTLSALCRDYAEVHKVERTQAETKIYNCLKENALRY